MRNGHFLRVLICGSVLGVIAAAADGRPATADDDAYGELVSDEYIVRVAHDADVAGIASAAGAVASPEQLAPGSNVYLITTPVVDAIATLGDAEGVLGVQPNPVTESPEHSGVIVRFWTDVHAPVGAPAHRYSVSDPAIGWSAEEVGHGGASVVAVLDTGIDAAHPAFNGSIEDGGFDAVDGDRNPAERRDGVDNDADGSIDEAFGHGTYVAGLVRLVNPSARILPIRVLDSEGRSSAWTVLRGIEYARRGEANVVSMSFGGGWLGPAVDELIKSMHESGTVFVAAAGNDGSAAQAWPAASDHVLAVNSIDATTGAVADFSNRGSWVDVVAPGVNIVSAFPGGSYVQWGGTSASAPLVAGLAASVRSNMAANGADDVMNAVTSTSTPVAESNIAAYGQVRPKAALTRSLNW